MIEGLSRRTTERIKEDLVLDDSGSTDLTDFRKEEPPWKVRQKR